MSDLIELLFEDIPAARLSGFVRVLIGQSAILAVDASEEGGSVESCSSRPESLLDSRAAAGAVTMTLDRVDFPLLTIQRPLLQVIKYDNVLDVSLSFTSGDVFCKGPEGPIKSLHLNAIELLALCEAKCLMCGYEPATDEKTRFFTNGRLGPVVEFW